MSTDYDPDLLPTLSDDGEWVIMPNGRRERTHNYLAEWVEPLRAYKAEKARADAAEARPAVDSVDPRALCVLGVDSDGHKRILIRSEDLGAGERWTSVKGHDQVLYPDPNPIYGFIQVAERTPEPETVTLTVTRDIAEQVAKWIVNDHDLLAIATAARRALAGEDADA
jgi:hypothetical protein